MTDSDAPRIEAYQFGQVTIDGTTHGRDVIILPDRVLGNWWRQEGHALHVDDIDPVFEAGPAVLVVGMGAHGRMRVTSSTRRALEEADIELIALRSEKACETYNDLREEKPTAAALHLTC